MRACIHRGAAEIGGSCLEVEHGGHRLVLDVGRPLSAARGDDVPLPAVRGLAAGDDPALLGVVISHGHQDHWGLMPRVHPDVPRYAGKATADILRAAHFWGTGTDLAETGHLHDRQPFDVGPFTVTPFLCDHSAFDAYSLLVEAGGSRLFYTGDFRAHGRKASRFAELVTRPPADIDVLVCEGTNLDRGSAGRPETEVSESQVERQMAATFRQATGLVAVLASPQNIDRLVTTYRAALRSGRDLVVDLYGADVAAATGRPTIPRPGAEWPRVHVYVPLRQRVRVKETWEFHRVRAVARHRLFLEDLAADPSRYILFGAYQGELARLLSPAGPGVAAVVWSMWDGYLSERSGVALRERLALADVPLIHHHTSGHASPAHIRELITALRPRRVVPIHTDDAHALAALTRTPATPVGDHEWWPVAAGDDASRRRDGSWRRSDEKREQPCSPAIT